MINIPLLQADAGRHLLACPSVGAYFATVNVRVARRG
jgi:hypothetical protein